MILWTHNDFLRRHMRYPVWIHCCKQPNYDFWILQGSEATVLRWGGQNYSHLDANFLRDVACQKLLKSANVSRSYSKNNTCTVFWDTVYLDRTFAQQIGSAKVKSKSEVTIDNRLWDQLRLGEHNIQSRNHSQDEHHTVWKPHLLHRLYQYFTTSTIHLLFTDTSTKLQHWSHWCSQVVLVWGWVESQNKSKVTLGYITVRSKA